MKIFYIILFLTPVLCNEIVFDVLSMDTIETNIIDNLPEDSNEKENSENAEEEKEIEYFDDQYHIDLNIENSIKTDNYQYLSKSTACILDITCPPPESN